MRTSNIPPFRVTYEMSSRGLPTAKVTKPSADGEDHVATIEAWSEDALVSELIRYGYIGVTPDTEQETSAK